MHKKVEQAIKVLRQGGIVIFPTDTAFAIGCRIDDVKAVERLFTIRKRPKTQAVPVLVDTVKMAQEYVEPIPKDVVDKLIEPYWPGALTIVLKCKSSKVPGLVRGGGNTLGVRIPNHPTARVIIREVGAPILGPSANFHGEKTPYSFDDLDPELVKQVDFVVEGECTVKQPARHASRALRGVAGRASTVIDCLIHPWQIIRQGAVNVQV